MKIKATAIKAMSLGTGLAISIILVAKICFELNYDRCYAGYENIYLIRTNYNIHGDESDYTQVSGAVAPGFKQYVPGVEAATRTTFLVESKRFANEDGNIISGSLILADSSYFDVFPTEILAENPKIILQQPNKIMVSRSFAEKLGGVQNAIGQTVTNTDMPDYKMTVGGVFEDFPYQSSQRYDVILSLESYSKASTDNWIGNDRYRGYVRLAKGVDDKMLDPAIRLMQEKNQPLDEIEKSGMKIRYYLAPLSKQHTSASDIKNMLIILSVTALLLLTISLMNYVLFSISAMVKRSKEIGVRKCYGAGTANIYRMMIHEAAVDTAVSLVIAGILILSIRNIVADLTGLSVTALFVPETLIVLAIILLIVFIAAALIPAMLYARIPVDSVIRNYKENKRVWKLTLLFIQICACVFMMSLVGVIGLQYDKAVNDKPGYDYADLLHVNLTGTDMASHLTLTDRLSGVSGVKDVQMSYQIPLNFSSGNNVYLPDSDNELFNIADQYEGSEGLFEMMNIPFVAGRYPQSYSEVAVSEGFLEKMAEFADWSDGAVGKQFRITGHDENGPVLTISGVYKDYRIGNLTRTDNRASVKFYGKIGKDYMQDMLVKVDIVNTEMLQKVNEVLKTTFPQQQLEFKAYKDMMKSVYSGERRMRNTVIYGCAVCILIALFGLIGYVRDESERRSKEMAIRKINGASTMDILVLFVGDIMKPAVIAAVLADTGAFFTAKVWLENFTQKISLSPLIFIVADIVVLAIVTITVTFNCIHISRCNPVESLKNE